MTGETGETREPASAPAAASPLRPRPRLASALRRYRATTVVGTIALLALGEVAAAALHAHETSSRAGWERAAQVVRAGFRPGDLVVFAPAWADPVGRMYLGDLLPIPVAGRMDSDRYARVWEVSLRGRVAPECRGAKIAQSETDGRVRVRLCVRAAPRILYDFVARAQADAHVPPELAEVDYGPKWCVPDAPPSRGATRVDFPAVPLGARLVVHAGIADFDNRHLYDKATGVYHNPPADLSVSIDGRVVGTLRSDSDSGWRRLDVDTRTFAGGTHEVTFASTAPRGAMDRALCFAAEARDGVGGGDVPVPPRRGKAATSLPPPRATRASLRGGF